MNAKYCRLIRQIVKERGYPPLIAKRIKKRLQKFEHTTPDGALINEILDVVDHMKEVYNTQDKSGDEDATDE